MLAESLDASIGWLAFIGLVVVAAGGIPLLAALLRRRLPEPKRAPRALPSVTFGSSPRARRSPRHAIRAHRSLLTAVFLTLLALASLALASAIGRVSLRGLVIAIGFVLPALLVAFQGRKRDFVGKRNA